LIAVVFDEGRLHRMQVLGLAETFDGLDFVAFVHHRKREARIHAPTVDQHSTGAALAVVAALFRAGEPEMFAQRIENGGARVDRQRPPGTVHGQRDIGFLRREFGAWRCLRLLDCLLILRGTFCTPE
jgi:hypothetical protein